jgi:hypothetical protein
VGEEEALPLLLLQLIVALKVRQVFLRVRYAAVVDFFKDPDPVKSVGEEEALLLLLLQLIVVTHQFQVSIDTLALSGYQ